VSAHLQSSLLFKRFKELDRLSEEDQQTVMQVVDAIITKHQVGKALKPI